MTSPSDFAIIRHVAALLAMDVHDFQTLREHIDREACRGRSMQDRDRIKAIVADIFGHADSGFEDPDAFLDQLHYVMGYSHAVLLGLLRDWLHDNDPRMTNDAFPVNQVGYGYARKRPGDRALAGRSA